VSGGDGDLVVGGGGGRGEPAADVAGTDDRDSHDDLLSITSTLN
jgi:hypothetical protein